MKLDWRSLAGKIPAKRSIASRVLRWDAGRMSATVTSTTVEADRIEVKNPASGGIAGHVPDMTAEVPALVARARTAQADWGSAAASRSARRCWGDASLDRRQPRQRSSSRRCARPARPTRTRSSTRSSSWPTRSGSGSVRRRAILRDDARPRARPAGVGPQVHRPPAPAWRRRGDRAVELPAPDRARRLGPGVDGRQRGRDQAIGDHAVDDERWW